MNETGGVVLNISTIDNKKIFTWIAQEKIDDSVVQYGKFDNSVEAAFAFYKNTKQYSNMRLKWL